MKKYLSISLLCVLIITSCNLLPKTDVSEITNLVDAVEVMVNRYDSHVQSALDSLKFEHISKISITATDSTNIKLTELKNLDVSSEQKDLQNVAINYIEALQGIIVAEKLYAGISDTTSLETAKEMDSIALQAINKSELARINYIEKFNILKADK